MKSNNFNGILISALALVVLFMGLFGSFLSKIFHINHIHYYFIIPSLLFTSCLVYRAKYIPFLFFLLATFLFFFHLNYLNFNAILSFFSVLAFPVIMFLAGKKIDLYFFSKIYLKFFLPLIFFGLLLEYFEVFPSIFPFIGYQINTTLGQRYGSFTFNPLALGYFGLYSFYFSLSSYFTIFKKNFFALLISLLSSLLLILFSNSRACYIILITSLAIYLYFKKFNLSKSLFLLLLVVLVFLILEKDRFLSIFDWVYDSGNIGRIYQWKQCVNHLKNNFFFGSGPGLFSPVGGDRSSDGLLKSCESFPLMLFVEYGFFIGLIYVYFFIKYIPFKVGNLENIKNNDLQNVLFLFLSLNYSFVISQLFNQSFQGIFLGGMFFMVNGYITKKMK